MLIYSFKQYYAFASYRIYYPAPPTQSRAIYAIFMHLKIALYRRKFQASELVIKIVSITKHIAVITDKNSTTKPTHVSG